MAHKTGGPVLVVMAAGLGSRFKGLKQIQPVDDEKHILMDYAVYDALEVGFSEVVFIIRKDFEDKFKEAIGNRIIAEKDSKITSLSNPSIKSASKALLRSIKHSCFKTNSG